MNKASYIRSLLSEEAKKLFDDIAYSIVLGANAQISLIITMIKDVLLNNSSASVEDLKTSVKNIIDYYQATRGQNSRAIFNALSIIGSSALSCNYKTNRDFKNALLDSIEHFEKISKQNVDTAVKYAVNITLGQSRIMCFDYSSTVEKFISALPPDVEIVIPESRALNGGRPYLNSLVKMERKIHYIPDTCMMQVLPSCDSVFIGAETIYVDGTVFNTVGSDILSVLAGYYKTPYYVLSPLIKLDLRSIYGEHRLDSMEYDYANRFTDTISQDLLSKLNCNSVKLISVPGSLITAFICEKGVLSPQSMFPIALDYAKEIGVSS